MAEIALCWYTIDDSSVTATREQAAAWVEELDLPTKILASSTTAGSFTKSCVETVVRYVGPDGEERCAQAVEVARRPELVTFEVRRGTRRLAQVRYFAARRTETGQVSGSARVRTTISSKLDDHDDAGASLWVDTFNFAYEQTRQIIPSKLVRRVALTCLLETATPIASRKWLYFCYIDQLAPVNRLREFLARVCDDADLTMLPIERGAELTTFIASADVDLSERIADFNRRLRHFARGRYLPRGGDMYNSISAHYRGLVARVGEHERRLSASLPSSHSLLPETRRLMRSADPSGNLLRVSEQ